MENYADEEHDWNEDIIDAVKCARDHITALPLQFRPRALAMLNVSFQDEINPQSYDPWQRHRYRPAVRRYPKKS